MPRKRRSAKSHQHRITPEAIDAYRAGDRIALHRALELPPWSPSPLDAEGPCPWPDRTGGETTWSQARQLRRALMEATGNAS